jgi:hypothetical protein
MLKKHSIIIVVLILLSHLELFSQKLSPDIDNTLYNGFIENKGQIIDQNNRINSEVLYLLSLPNLNLQLRKSGFSYDTYTVSNMDDSATTTEINNENTNQEKLNKEIILNFHRIDVELLNINKECQIAGQKPLLDYENYFSKYIKNKQAIEVKKYNKVLYHNIYPSIDLEFIIKNGKPKFNFILYPGADITKIKWKYKGMKSSKIVNGKIELRIETGSIIEDIPYSFYNNEDKEEVKMEYQYFGNNVYGFKNKTNDINKTLVIDPIPELLWATYYGGLLESMAKAVTVDADNNIFVSGYTYSASNIATSGAFQSTLSLSSASFYTKFSTTGQRLYGTLYSGISSAEDINCDTDGNIIISGLSYQDSMGTAGVFQSQKPTGRCGHIAKFDNQGNRIWATYFGAYDISVFSIYSAIDSSNNIIIGGKTYSNDTVITTVGTYQPGNNSSLYSGKGYISKLNSNGQLVWGTYVGSNGLVRPYKIATDKWNNILIAGLTHGSTNIGTLGTFFSVLPMPNNPTQLAFLMKFDSTGQKIWGTFYGPQSVYGQYGDGYCKPSALTTDLNGNIIMAGKTTASYDTISTAGVCQTTFGGGNMDDYIVKFNPNGTRNWASYYGGSNGTSYEFENCFSINTDLFGNIYLLGHTNSTNNITTPNALTQYLDSIYVGSGALQIVGSGFIAKLTPSGQRIYGTYYRTGIRASKIDTYGNIIIAGVSDSANVYTNANSFQPNIVNIGTFTAHFSLLSDCDLPDTPIVTVSDSIVCPGEQISLNINGQLNDATQWNIYQNNTLLGNTSSNTIQININDTMPILVKGVGGCVVKSDPAILNIAFDSIPIVDAGADTTAVCYGYGLVLNATGNAQSYLWSNGVTNGTAYSPTSNHQLVVTGIGYNGCTNTDTINVVVNPTPIVTYTNGFSSICIDAAPRPVYGGLPAGGDYSGPGLYNGIFYPDSVGLGTYQIIYQYTDSNGCSAAGIDFILVDPCIGFDEIENKLHYNIYPNPAYDNITFEVMNLIGYYSIAIFDSKGTEVIFTKTNKTINKINISKLSSGTYYFNIIQKDKVKTSGNFIVK